MAATRRAFQSNRPTYRPKATKRPNVQFGLLSHTTLLTILLVMMSLFYLTQITRTTSYGYALRELDERKAELLATRNDLQIENARLQAMDRLYASEVAASMVEPSERHFVKAAEL